MKVQTVKECAGCGAPLRRPFADLGHMPPANSLVRMAAANHAEIHLPLRAGVCESCFLVQLLDRADSEAIFADNYAYFSSFSRAWLAHAEAFAREAAAKLGAGPGRFVVEIASNDGYLLQYMAKTGATCLGVEPASNVADVAIARGIPTLKAFFGRETARRVRDERGAADLIVANNVLAHVPALDDFVGGIATLLADDGTASIEFPHLLNLIEKVQFDTIYHEHFYYYSVLALEPLFARQGLVIVDVTELPTHGGSLRLYLRHATPSNRPTERPAAIVARERAAGLATVARYETFQAEIFRVANEFSRFLLAEAGAGRTVAGYGAAAKCATLLNTAGIRPHLLPFVCDASPHKQGHLLPGSRIPILSPDEIAARRPDTVVIFPWNIKSEIAAALDHVRAWGGKFATAIPRMDVF